MYFCEMFMLDELTFGIKDLELGKSRNIVFRTELQMGNKGDRQRSDWF